MNILNMHMLKKLPIPLPPFDEQKEIIRLYEKNFSLISYTKLQIQNLHNQSVMLKKSILKKAFEGELVPQIPSSESASEILEKIKKENKKLQKNKKAAIKIKTRKKK